MKYNLFSPLLSSVSGERQVLQVTYSTSIMLVAYFIVAELLLTDISSQNVLDLFLLETTLDDQTSASVDGTARTQFSKQI